MSVETLCDIVSDLRNLVSYVISENAYEQKSFDKFRDALLRLNNLQLALDAQKELSQKELSQKEPSEDNDSSISWVSGFDTNFVNNYEHKVDWYNVCICKEISEKCMIDNNIHWKSVSIYQTLSPEFIDKHIDKLHIPSISYFQDLPDWLIEKYKDKWDWGLLSCKTDYSDTLREKMRDEYIESVVRNRIIWDISEDILSEATE